MMHISVTSGLVLNWSKEDVYRASPVKEYFSLLDLSESYPLLDEIDGICNYYDQVLKNRKTGILNTSYDYIKKHLSDETQVVILAAGFNPLSLELVTHYENILAYDIDIENMDEKKELLGKLNVPQTDRIKCITLDITEKEKLIKNLKNSGFDPKKPTILVVEGISYYLETQKLWNTINLFNTNTNKNYLIFEYLVTEELIIKKLKHIPHKVFWLIAKECKIPDITRYNRNDIKNLLAKRTHKTLKFETMQKIEHKRFGKNIYFPTQSHGWLEISSCYI